MNGCAEALGRREVLVGHHAVAVLVVPAVVEATLPNLAPTADPEKVLTASFASNKEVWA